MKRLLIILSLLYATSAIAQENLPVIKATSKSVAIKDGEFFDKNAWSLSPTARPDVYTADRTRKTKWVTFYTDVDSIRVKVTPGSISNFVILLNGKDSCYTQVRSAIPAVETTSLKIDTIPFELTDYNAIKVKAILNNVDTVNLHFDIGSFDFHFTKDAIQHKTHLLQNQPDALAGKTAINFNKLTPASLRMGTAIWRNAPILPTVITAHDMDGRFGWNLFEGKTVELNYDKKLIIIRPMLPKYLSGYKKTDLNFVRGYVCTTGTFAINGRKYRGDFLMDTGSEQAVIVDSSWAAKQHFPTDLKLIRSSVLSDPRGVKYEIKIVEAPLLSLNGFGLTNVPALLLANKNPTGLALNYLGNGALKRFNIIFDFKNDVMYLKPNRLFAVKYRQES